MAPYTAKISLWNRQTSITVSVAFSATWIRIVCRVCCLHLDRAWLIATFGLCTIIAVGGHNQTRTRLQQVARWSIQRLHNGPSNLLRPQTELSWTELNWSSSSVTLELAPKRKASRNSSPIIACCFVCVCVCVIISDSLVFQAPHWPFVSLIVVRVFVCAVIIWPSDYPLIAATSDKHHYPASNWTSSTFALAAAVAVAMAVAKVQVEAKADVSCWTKANLHASYWSGCLSLREARLLAWWL